MVGVATVAGIASVVLVQALSPTQYRISITTNDAAAKIYSAQPSPLGVPLRVLPPSVVAIWPAPQSFTDATGSYTAYPHTVTGTLQAPARFGNTVQMRYGVCHDVCILEQVQFKLSASDRQ